MEMEGQVVKKMSGAALHGEGAAAASATVSDRGVARDERLGVHDKRGVSFLAREKREHAAQGGGALDWRRASQSQMARCEGGSTELGGGWSRGGGWGSGGGRTLVFENIDRVLKPGGCVEEVMRLFLST